MAFVRDYLGRPVPEETFTSSHSSCSSDILYQLPPSTVIRPICWKFFTCLSPLEHPVCRWTWVSQFPLELFLHLSKKKTSDDKEHTFLLNKCPSCRQANTVKALKGTQNTDCNQWHVGSCTTWMKNIHADLSLLDLGIHEARDLVQNRPLCRLPSLHSATHLEWIGMLSSFLHHQWPPHERGTVFQKNCP